MNYDRILNIRIKNLGSINNMAHSWLYHWFFSFVVPLAISVNHFAASLPARYRLPRFARSFMASIFALSSSAP